jgi:hypothetical protein
MSQGVEDASTETKQENLAMQKKTGIVISIVIIISMATGCGMSTLTAKTGSGDPAAPRALFMTEKNVAISTIDGKNVFVTARNWWVPAVTKTKASVMPGKHTLVVTYAQTGWSSRGCRVTIDAQPGRTYLVKGKRLPFDNASGFAAVKRPQIATVVVWVEDAQTGEKVIAETECEPVT